MVKKAAHRLIQGGIQAIPAAHHQSHVQVRSCAVPQGEAVDGTYMQVQVVLVAGAEVQEETRVTMMEGVAGQTVGKVQAHWAVKGREPLPVHGVLPLVPNIPAEAEAAVPEDAQQVGLVETGAEDAEGMECAQSQAHRKGPSGMVLLQELLVRRILEVEAAEAEADAVEVPDAEPMVLMAALVSYS